MLVYLAFSFIVTHIPGPKFTEDELPTTIPLDKLFHFGGFAVMSFLVVHALSRRIRHRLAVPLTVVLLSIYGVIDELTQPYFHRSADPMDFAADIAGIGVGIVIWLYLRQRSGGKAGP